MKVYVARDENGELYFYSGRPKKESTLWNNDGSECAYLGSDENVFPNVKWEDDEPTEVVLKETSTENCANAEVLQEEAIDWEQRRYEIAKEMMPILSERGYRDSGVFINNNAKTAAKLAVKYADALIEELKGRKK